MDPVTVRIKCTLRGQTKVFCALCNTLTINKNACRTNAVQIELTITDSTHITDDNDDGTITGI